MLVITVPTVDFNCLWTQAVAGLVKHAHIAFAKPHYNTSLVVSVFLSGDN